MSHASAPGKIILFGEHAVVYNRPALAAPVTQVHTDVEVRGARRAGIWFDAPDVRLRAELSRLPAHHALRSTVELVFKTLEIGTPPHLEIKITSGIPVASGLGSGAAVSVALARALAAYLARPLSAEQVNQIAYEIEKIHHGTPSGIDNTVISYARPVFFIKGQPIETLRVQAVFTIVIADTGISAPTRESVGDLRRLWTADPLRWEAVFERVGQIAWQARQAIESGDWPALGPLMDANQALLEEMTVSSPELERLIRAARDAGAEGAKLSGGGRGGNMIALVKPENAERVAGALLSAGARKTITTHIA